MISDIVISCSNVTTHRPAIRRRVDNVARCPGVIPVT
jgi:hypothetical protein